MRAGADLSLEFALPNTNQPIGVSTICSFREDPACFLLHFRWAPFGGRAALTLLCLIPEREGRFFILWGFN